MSRISEFLDRMRKECRVRTISTEEALKDVEPIDWDLKDGEKIIIDSAKESEE